MNKMLQAVKDLYNNKNTVIKQADKGYSIVFMDTIDYTLVKARDNYEKISSDSIIPFNRRITNIMQQAWRRNIIDGDTKEKTDHQ